MENYKNQTTGKEVDTSGEDLINLDYDWNSEYGDGDIPDIDKNSVGSTGQMKSKKDK